MIKAPAVIHPDALIHCPAGSLVYNPLITFNASTPTPATISTVPPDCKCNLEKFFRIALISCHMKGIISLINTLSFRISVIVPSSH